MKIPGLVILYNPNISDVISNASSYLSSLEVLYVFDNSDNGNIYKEMLEDFSPKIKYYSFNENMGIAFALNYISQIVHESNFKWILTMDQDSSFLIPNGFDNYIRSFLKELNDKTAIFSPYFKGENKDQPQFYTSGALMNLKVWNEIGKFDENLFIDEVDGDFTYRLLEANFRLVKINNIELVHELGDKYCRKFLWKTLCSDNHSAIRKYYIARNRIYLMKKRPSMRSLYFFDSLRKFILLILIEQDKKRKFVMLIRGIYDGLTNKMGKYNKDLSKNHFMTHIKHDEI